MQKLSSVLLVDDDETTNYLNAHLLKQLGVTNHVLVAHNGQEALALLAQHCGAAGATCPALVLLDLQMPVMSGIDFLAAYQPQPPAQAICVVVLTSSVHPHDLSRLRGLRHLAVLQKPLTRVKISALLQEHFQRQLTA
ncbi:response regulator [Hymenobacter sp. HMF4947]|uniref:Response regulator n=1 Tax=Hymenobacter ginkgonis TaxID=2682976 RepID=A0A7K1TK89_9BACT|nr:response regulator [Hymenobacter ginkgonis]MVN78825.1 response regulator [Hymenobacter ginkgonis]